MAGRSAIWGGATLGFIVGLIVGFFVEPYWRTVFYSVLIGAGLGVGAEILGRIGDIMRRRG